MRLRGEKNSTNLWKTSPLRSCASSMPWEIQFLGEVLGGKKPGFPAIDGGNSNIFYFQPCLVELQYPIWLIFFQMSWNHQLARFSFFPGDLVLYTSFFLVFFLRYVLTCLMPNDLDEKFGCQYFLAIFWRDIKFTLRKDSVQSCETMKARWWFQMFSIFTFPPIWRAYFSDGLAQPPTRKRRVVYGSTRVSMEVIVTSW